ncbi:amino acid adenylation domain-containing protein, partial [Chitinophagaceae bacterium LB-8]
GFNQTEAAYPNDKSIVALFEQQVEKTSHSIAVVFEERQLTYQELNERSNQLAHYLRGKGVKEETLVPLCLDRSLEMMVGILGILKAGAAYVPIDPEYPQERITYMLQDTAAAIVVSSQEYLDLLSSAQGSWEVVDLKALNHALAHQPTSNPQTNLQASHLAYVIYTSGSTGTPKGVMVEHSGVVNLLYSIAEHVQFTAHASMLAVTTYSFDICYLEFFLPLLSGARLILLSREVAQDGFRLAESLHRHTPTHMQATPSTWMMLLESGWQNREGITILVGGEAVGDSLKDQLTRWGHVYNVYGPTETTIWSTLRELKKEERVTIGAPLANTQVYILDEEQGLQPIGVAGEICIGGAGLARGYLNRQELTREKFIASPFKEGERLYRTGDMGRWLQDGTIECLGRRDEQVKIRGVRIELGEIEAVVQQSGQVSQSVVVAKENSSGGKRLVGYVVAEEAFNKDHLIDYLKARLPEYMVPLQWLQLEQLPLTPNGKINRRALPEVEVSANNRYVAPTNEVQQQLVQLWGAVLGIEPQNISVEDNFFELGGHSLLAMRMIAAVRKELQVELAIKELFFKPTVAQLAQHLQAENREVLLPAIEAVVQRPERLPLSFAQERLWFIDQLEGSVQYHIPAVLRLKGTLNKEALQHAFQTIIERHEVLRTVFLQQEGQSFQYIQTADGWRLAYREDRSLSDQESLEIYLHQQINAPFDLSRDYMLRAELINLEAEEHILIVVLHHIASDGWSTSILVRELVALYGAYSQGHAPQLAPLPIQYADYALWQRNYLQGEVLAHKLTYW